MVESANDTEVPRVLGILGDVLTPEMRDMLNRLGELGLGTKFVIDVMRSHLREHGVGPSREVKIALPAFGRVIDRTSAVFQPPLAHPNSFGHPVAP